MSQFCEIFKNRNNNTELRENSEKGLLRCIDNTTKFTFCGRDQIEQECKDKIPICFESNCDNLRCQNIIIVYSNKKTGSMTLFSSLCLYFSDITSIFHFHNKNDFLCFNVDSFTVPDFCSYLSEKRKKVTVIEIYRPILELCISNFFFALEKYSRPMKENETMEEYVFHLIQVFNNIFPFLINICKEEKLCNDFGANLSNQNSDYSLFIEERNNITYILVRLKDSEHWSNILKPYLPEGEFNIHSENETGNKCHGDLYSLFKKIYKLPKNYLDVIKSEKSFLKYYSEEEQTEYLDILEKKLSNEKHTPLTSETYKEYLKSEVTPNNNDEIAILKNILNHNRSSLSNCMCDECVDEREATLSFYKNMEVLFQEER